VLFRSRGRHPLQGYRLLKVGVNPDRAELHRRINHRVEQMFARGLIHETRTAFDARQPGDAKVLGALGYRQAAAAIRGEITEQEAILQTQAATRRYAKRQMTWFRREPDVQWFAGFGDDPDVQQQVCAWLDERAI